MSATGKHGGELLADSVEWLLGTNEINIAAGRLATGYVSLERRCFGSDNFLSRRDRRVDRPRRCGRWQPEVEATKDPQLYEFHREGEFSQEFPLANGRYELALGFIEPSEGMHEGDRMFDVTANGETRLESFDVLEVAHEARRAVTRRFTTNVADGHLLLEFLPEEGEAVLANVIIALLGAERQDSKERRLQ